MSPTLQLALAQDNVAELLYIRERTAPRRRGLPIILSHWAGVRGVASTSDHRSNSTDLGVGSKERESERGRAREREK